MSAGRRKGLRIDGILLLDKARGQSSNAALQSARRLYSAAKAGHTGTLDPLASGLLPLCFGEATKFSADLLNADKAYEADVVLGATTDTGDAEGEVRERRPVAVTREQLEIVLEAFRGEIEQIPPMYSALKRNGRPLYELARQGVEVERAARRVTIHELELLDFGAESCRLRVACSKGTYIRTLAEDIGERLGCGAHLGALRRTAVGNLRLEQAVTLAALEGMGEAERAACLLPVDALLQSLPAVELGGLAAQRFAHGNAVAVASDAPAGKCRVYADGQLLGVGEVALGAVLQPQRLIAGSP